MRGSRLWSQGAAGSSLYRTTVVADTPLIYAREGEASGSTALDSSGNSRNGTYQNGGPTFGVSGAIIGDSDTAATYNGVDRYATFPSTGLPSTDQDQTVELWIKYTTTAQGLVAGRENGAARGHSVWIFSGKLMCGNAGTAFAQSPSTYNDGNWHYVQGIRHQAAGTFELRVDKVSVATVSGSNPVSATGFYIASRGGSDFFAAATVDEVAYYGYAQTTTQGAAHWTASGRA